MTSVSSVFVAKWLSKIRETLILITSVFVFLILDLLDVIMCFLFRIFDQLFDGKSSHPCYCMKRIVKEEKVESLGEKELSNSLNGRKNVFRKMGLVRISTKWSREKESEFCVEEKKRNRWSDCGCDSCVYWMRNGSDCKLHFVVKETHIARLSYISEEEVENVIFVHGFLSSSSIWTETVFPNFSKPSNRNYKLFAVDLLGFGRSPKPKDCLYTLVDHIEMIEKSVIAPFQLQSFHLVAHSMGCVVALGLAAKYPESVKSITLVAPPYISSSEGDVTSVALRTLAPRRVWPPLLFGSAFMSWYEHLGRCVCFFLCRNHRLWESIVKLITRKRDLHFAFMDLTRHTHHSAWHTMHNVICGGAKFLDKYLDILRAARVRIHVIQGTKDQVVPLRCSYSMKMKDPDIELDIIPNADHSSVIMDSGNDFTRKLENIWESMCTTTRKHIDVRQENGVVSSSASN